MPLPNLRTSVDVVAVAAVVVVVVLAGSPVVSQIYKSKLKGIRSVKPNRQTIV